MKYFFTCTHHSLVIRSEKLPNRLLKFSGNNYITDDDVEASVIRDAMKDNPITEIKGQGAEEAEETPITEEAKEDVLQCKGETASGRRCKKPATTEDGYCKTHQPGRE